MQFGDNLKVKDTKRSLVSDKITILLGQEYNVLVSLYVLKMIERTQKQIQELFIEEFKLVCTSWLKLMTSVLWSQIHFMKGSKQKYVLHV